MKLVYFNGRGLAETSRLLLAVAEQEYEDFRYPLEVLDWSTHSFKREAFDQDKAAGKLAASLDKLPYLELDGGTVIPQSKAVERFLAGRFGMLGDSAAEAAQVDAICEFVRDFKQEYQAARKLAGAEREAAMYEWFGTTLPARMHALEASGLVAGAAHAVGERTSLADVTLYAFITQFFDEFKRARAALATTPRLRGVVDGVAALAPVQAWLAARPDTPF